VDRGPEVVFDALARRVAHWHGCSLDAVALLRDDRYVAVHDPHGAVDGYWSHLDDAGGCANGLMVAGDGDSGPRLLVPLSIGGSAFGVAAIAGPEGSLESNRASLAAVISAHAAKIDAAADALFDSIDEAGFGESEEIGTERVASLLHLAAILGESHEPRRVLPEAAYRATVATGFARATLFLIDDDDVLSATIAVRGDGSEDLRLVAVFADIGAPPRAIKDAVDTGKPAVFRNAAEVRELAPDRWLVPGGPATVVVLPLSLHGAKLGALVLDDPAPDAADRIDLGFLIEAANWAATVVGVSRTLDREKANREKAQAVLSTVVQAATQANTAGVLSVIADGVGQVLGDETTVAFVLDSARPGRLAVTGNGAAAFSLIENLGNPDLFPGGLAPLNGRRGNLRTLYGETLQGGLRGVDRRIGRLLIAPLRRASRDIGWVVSYDASDEPYEDGPQRIVASLAAQASLSLHTALLLEAERSTVTRLEELDQLKTSFVAAVSHELRTPLTAIVGFAEILAERILDGEDREFLEDIRRESSVLESLIANLLDSSRLEAGMLELDQEPCDIRRIVQEAIGVVEHGYPERRIEVRPIPDLGPVLADPVRLRQVLLNIVENAVKYSPDGTSVEVSVIGRHDFIEFIVDDEGPGIPPEQRDLIFERFHRLAGNEKPGSGIGLYLVRALVEAHGGTIDVLDGTRGYGTRFVVCIPRVAVPAS
jgi:signal transduction histidine kinase